MDVTVRPATSAQWPAFEDLSGRSGASNGCWCMYWRIGPRYRDRPRADNRKTCPDRGRAADGGHRGRPGPGGLTGRHDRAVAYRHPVPRIAAAFARHGFEVVVRRKPGRPVMRKLLGDVRDFST